MTLQSKLRSGSGILIVVGLLLSGFGLARVLEAGAASGWPSTTGVVKRSWVDKRTEVRAGLQTLTYRPRIEYTYQVDGQTYESDDIARVQTDAGFRSPAYTLTARFPENARVTVFYRGDRPSESVLVAEATPESAGLLLLGLTLLVLGGPVSLCAPALARHMEIDRSPAAVLVDPAQIELEVELDFPETAEPDWTRSLVFEPDQQVSIEAGEVDPSRPSHS